MAEHPAIPIDTVQGHMLTDDGSRLLIKTEQPLALAVQTSALHDLLAAVIAGLAEARARAPQGNKEKLTFAVEWWEIGVSQDGASMVLSFRLGNGAEFCFQIGRDQAPHMRDVLSTITGNPPRSTVPGGAVQ
ncbi:hypothetical protein [Cupriavidus sp.]|uniref:hypothetical protein n=1 Tax=Cupriavidus sp. TaxID=1873897 RepID=UPI0028BDBA69|nr:hypothetical protein [Cupriavidus sp.]